MWLKNAEAPGSARWGFLIIKSGDDLLSHVVANAVPWALEGLTAVFGMGTGVTPPLESPEIPRGEIAAAPSNFDQITTFRISSRVNFMVKPHDRLVLVSFMRCRTSTPSLLPGGLPGVFSPPRREEGISYLGVGFTLICFQRLSRPNLAIQLCRWHDNWCTRGSSIPVLSY